MTATITVAYVALLAWGLAIGVRQVLDGRRHPERLLNPLFAHPVALQLFTVHLVVVSADLFLIGPWAVEHKSTLWYWGGRVALLLSSLPLAAYLNRNPQSFGRFIGRWVTIRNLFEYAAHVVVAAMPVDWFAYYLLLWWLVAYRYLDVGPRRALQRLYDTPEKRAARPWAEYLNFAVITAIYVLAFLAVYHQQVLFADVPPVDLPAHEPARWEVGAVVAGNLALAMYGWLAIRRYTESPATRPDPARSPAGH